MTVRTVSWLWLTVYLYGSVALGYRVANLPHFPLRSQTGDLVWWIDVLLFNTGMVAFCLGGILARISLTKRIGHPRTIKIITSTIVLGVLGFVVGWLISLVLHTLNPSLYQGWSNGW